MEKFLNSQERKEFLSELKIEKKRKYADRIKVILRLDQNWTYKKISEALFLDKATITNYLKRYKSGRIEELINDFYHGKKSILSQKEQDLLIKDLQSKIFPTTATIIAYIRKKFNIQYSRDGVTELLDGLGFSFKKATPIPGNANKEEQKKFINQYNDIKSDGPVDFADSAHPEFAHSISYGWIKTGKNFNIKTNSRMRKRVNICGAIEINSLYVVASSFKTTNHQSICQILRAIQAKNPDEERVSIIFNEASHNKFQKIKELSKKLKIRILYLPPYSPNLNPIKRLWKFMKNNVTANHYFEKFPEFKNMLMEFFRGIRKYKPEIESLITDNFQIVGT